MIRKTGAFDNFFEKCHRKRGQTVDSFLRQRTQVWADLLDITDGTSMSEDLLAYFLLKNIGLSKDERRQILLANQSSYTLEGVEKALRVSFYDIHEKEKSQRDWSTRRPGSQGWQGKKNYAHMAADGQEGDFDVDDDPIEYDNGVPEDSYAVEDEVDDGYAVGQEFPPPSDQGASEDDEVYEAYAAMDKQRKTYRDSRNHLKTLQKNRGFFRDPKNDGNAEARKAAVAKEKQRSRCAACGRIGHWAGDAACVKSSQSGAKKFEQKKKPKGRGKGKANMVSEAPLFFTLDFPDDQEDQCMMVSQQDDNDETSDPLRDADLDARRKMAVPMSSPSSGSEWEQVQEVAEKGSVYASGYGAVTSMPTPIPESSTVKVTVEVEIPMDQIRVLLVPSFEEVRPDDLAAKKTYELTTECQAWGIATGGNKVQLFERLTDFFNGKPVLRKGCSKQYVQLRIDASQSSSQGPLRPVPRAQASAVQAKAKVKSRAAPKAYSYAMENDQFADEQSQGFNQESSLSFSPAFQRSVVRFEGSSRSPLLPPDLVDGVAVMPASLAGWHERQHEFEFSPTI